MNCYDLRRMQVFGALVDLYAAQTGKAVAFIRKSLSPFRISDVATWKFIDFNPISNIGLRLRR